MGHHKERFNLLLETIFLQALEQCLAHSHPLILGPHRHIIEDHLGAICVDHRQLVGGQPAEHFVFRDRRDRKKARAL